MTRIPIDDSSRARPVIRLSHKILREGLSSDLKSIVFEATGGAMPCARAQKEGRWVDLMAFPPAVYDDLASYLCEMAGLTQVAEPVGGTINISIEERPAAIGLVARRDQDGHLEITLLFPTAPVAAAT